MYIGVVDAELLELFEEVTNSGFLHHLQIIRDAYQLLLTKDPNAVLQVMLVRPLIKDHIALILRLIEYLNSKLDSNIDVQEFHDLWTNDLSLKWGSGRNEKLQTRVRATYTLNGEEHSQEF